MVILHAVNPNKSKPGTVQIAVISMPAAADRRESASWQLRALGLGFDFIDAVDGTCGAAMFTDVDAYRHILHTGRPPLPGEIGCYASHKMAWQQCCDSGEPLCILEDDFEAENFLPEVLSSAKKWIDAYGFIRLQTETRGQKFEVATTGRFVLHRYTKMPHSTVAYVIAPRVARRFISASRIMAKPVDVFIKRYWEHRQPLYGLTPYAVTEGPLSSTSIIGTRVRVRKDPITRLRRSAKKVTSLARRLSFNMARD